MGCEGHIMGYLWRSWWSCLFPLRYLTLHCTFKGIFHFCHIYSLPPIYSEPFLFLELGKPFHSYRSISGLISPVYWSVLSMILAFPLWHSSAHVMDILQSGDERGRYILFQLCLAQTLLSVNNYFVELGMQIIWLGSIIQYFYLYFIM